MVGGVVGGYTYADRLAGPHAVKIVITPKIAVGDLMTHFATPLIFSATITTGPPWRSMQRDINE